MAPPIVNLAPPTVNTAPPTVNWAPLWGGHSYFLSVSNDFSEENGT